MRKFKQNFKTQKIFHWATLIFVLCFLVTISSCRSNVSPQSLVSATESQADTQPLNQSATEALSTPSPVLTQTQLLSGESVELEPTMTATPDVRLDPADWMNWPVVPELSGRAKDIYLSGIKQGRNPGSFSKIGDCQSIREVLLGIYDLPGRYFLGENDLYLQETIEQFKGSFDRDGYAVKGGFNAATVLSPIWADPEMCLAGENPLACEFRVHNPSMVIISLEVWWDGRTPDRYEQYMRKIIEYSISQGILPILSTKADNVEGDHSINLVTAKLAYEYDIPLWNFWLAAQSLPYQGIDPDRDGFHITVAAWNERSYTALKTIDHLWHSAIAEGGQAQVVDAEAGVPTIASFVASDEDFSRENLNLEGFQGNIFFELSQISPGGGSVTTGVYKISFADDSLIRILPSGYQLLAASDGYLLAVERETNKVSLRDYSGEKISHAGVENLNYLSGGGSIIDSEQALVIGSIDDVSGIWLIEINSGQIQLAVPSNPADTQIDVSNSQYFYWTLQESDCAGSECNEKTLYQTDLVALTTDKIVPGGLPKVDESGKNYVYYLTQEDIESIYISPMEKEASQYVGLYGNVLLDYEWSNDGNQLVVLKMVRSDYFGKATDALHYVIDNQTLTVREYAPIFLLNPDVEWSPDDETLLTAGTVVNDENGEYEIGMRMLNLSSGSFTNLGSHLAISATEYITISRIIWID